MPSKASLLTVAAHLRTWGFAITAWHHCLPYLPPLLFAATCHTCHHRLASPSAILAITA
ncbi:MAG: hypothetical protein LBG97_03095 [Coriobacteriales bacterium]|nr:hypothetical protein [Coriobacteriales bacterium]